MTSAKQRAQERLAQLVDPAFDTLELDCKQGLPYARGSTRAQTARFIAAAALELEEVSTSGRLTNAEKAVAKLSVEDVAKISERLRLVRQEERKQA